MAAARNRAGAGRGAGGTRWGQGRVVVIVGEGPRHPYDALMTCRCLCRWRQGRGVVDRVGVRGGVAVGQGRERGRGARTAAVAARRWRQHEEGGGRSARVGST